MTLTSVQIYVHVIDGECEFYAFLKIRENHEFFRNFKSKFFKLVKFRDFPIFNCLECNCIFICVLHLFIINHCELSM